MLNGADARPNLAVVDPLADALPTRGSRRGDRLVALHHLWLFDQLLTPAMRRQACTQARYLVAASTRWGASRSLIEPPLAQGIAGQTAAIRTHDTLERLGQIAVAPTLVLVGAQDIVTPVVYSEELAKGIPGATLQVLDLGGHGSVAVLSTRTPCWTKRRLLEIPIPPGLTRVGDRR